MLNLTAYAELLRNDVQAQKIAILTEVMGFTEAEDKAFWPIYRDYNTEMATLGDERVKLISEYTRRTHISPTTWRGPSPRAQWISTSAGTPRSNDASLASARRCRRGWRSSSWKSSTSCF